MGLTFAADWLSLREPFDHAARAPAVTAAALAHLDRLARPLVVDLGCGRGSNLRFLSRALPSGIRWRLVDHDAALLEEAAASAGASVETRLRDLRHGALDAVCEGAALVTAAALIDLVSADWLDRLVRAAEGQGAALLVTGSVDGRVDWAPELPDDIRIAAAYRQHQGGDKGFGNALGTKAPTALVQRLADRGWRVVEAHGDWEAVEEPLLQRAYLEGVIAALGEQGAATTALEGWVQARTRLIDAGASRLTVGHIDLFATPPAR